MTITLSVLAPLQIEYDRTGALRDFLKATISADNSYIDVLQQLLKLPRPKWPNGSLLNNAVETLIEALREDVAQRRASIHKFTDAVETLEATLNTLNEGLQSVEAQYQELVQAEDVKTARTRTEVAYTARMAPVTPGSSQGLGGFLHRRRESKTEVRDEERERLKEVVYLKADLQERHAICALRGERAAFEQSIPKLVVSSASRYQDALVELHSCLKALGNYRIDVARAITAQASDLHLQSHRIVPHAEASRVQALMEASQTTPFKAEEYCNLAFKQTHVTSQPILFGEPLPTTVPANHLLSDFPPVFLFFLQEPIAFPSQALSGWPKSINDMVNELEQAWDTGNLSLNERLRSKSTLEQRGVLVLRYIDCLPTPLLQLDKHIVSLLSHPDTHESIKIDAMVNKWKGTLQGNMATEIFVRLEDLLDEVDDEWWSWMTKLFTRRSDVLDFKTFRAFVTAFTYLPSHHASYKSEWW